MPSLGNATSLLQQKTIKKGNALDMDTLRRNIEEVKKQLVMSEETLKKSIVTQKNQQDKETDKKIKASLVPINSKLIENQEEIYQLQSNAFDKE